MSLTDELDLDAIEPPAFSPESEFLKKEESTQVQQAVNRLPEKFKLPILLFYMEDLPLAQIAEVLKITNASVLYGNALCHADFRASAYSGRNRKKQAVSGQKTIRKRIGGCFR